MKIIELQIDNFMRLKAVHITPDQVLQQITGRNAQGKTSVLNAVWAALGGKDAAPAKPIRDGEKSASVEIMIGDFVVTRRWTSDERSTLTVKSKEGASYPSPQKMLDGLVGALSFDPLFFVRMSAKIQAQTLRNLIGVDTSKDDAERAQLYENRTEKNRRAKELDAQAGPPIDAPDEEVSIAALVTEAEAARAKIADNERLRKKKSLLVAEFERADGEIKNLEVLVLAAKLRASEVKAARDLAAKEVDAIVEPDHDAVVAKIGSAEEVNRTVRAKKERHEKLMASGAAAAEAEGLTEKIAKIDARKAAGLSKAKFPIEGIAVDGDVVTFKGLPLTQASSAEQLRVGLAIGAALNPRLRVILVRDGSLLDAEGMGIVADWAAKEDMQVLMERVATGDKIGVVIEDGEVAP